MEQKRISISITICDDCMDIMDIDGVYDDIIRVRRRECMYVYSAVISVIFLGSLFWWCYVILMDMEKLEGNR